MGFRAVFVLLLLIGGIVFGLWWTERESADNGTGGAVTEAVLGEGRRLLQATRMELQFSLDRPAVEIERGERAGFVLAEPVRDLASEAVLQSLARIYDSARMKLDFVTEDVTEDLLVDRGLAPRPRGRARFEWEDGGLVEIEFGKIGPFGNELFIRRDGAIYSASAALHSAMTLNLQMFRESRIFRNAPGQVGQVQVSRRSLAGSEEREVLTFVRKGDGYEIAERPHLDLNQHEVTAFIDGVLSLRADRFLRGRRNLGPRTPDCIVSVKGPYGDEEVELTIDDRDQMFGWASPRKVEFYANPQTYERVFTAPLEALRTRLLYSPELIDELQQVTISGPNGEVGLSKDPARGMLLVLPVRSDTNPTPVNELRTALQGFGVVAFVDDDPQDLERYGLEEPQMVLKLQGLTGGGARREGAEIKIGRAEGPMTFAQRVGSPNVVAVPSAAVEVFARPWLEYVGLDVMEIPSHVAVTKISVRDGETDREVFLRGDDGAWRPSGAPDGPRADEVADVFDAARKLVGRRAIDVEAAQLDREGAEPRLVFTVSTGQTWATIALYPERDPMLVRRLNSDQTLARVAYELSHRDAQDLREVLQR